MEKATYSVTAAVTASMTARTAYGSQRRRARIFGDIVLDTVSVRRTKDT